MDASSIGPQELTFAATNLITGAPLLLVWLVGIGLAAARWRRHPRVSLLVILACGIGVATDLIRSVLSVVPLVMRRGSSSAQIGLVVGVIGFVTVLCSTVAWALMLGAAFSGRAQTAPLGRAEASPQQQPGETAPGSDRL